MWRIFSICLFCVFIIAPIARTDTQQHISSIFAERSDDWRNRQIVYQIFVDRFARSPNFPLKKHKYYKPPRKLHRWSDQPAPGVFLEQAHCWSHEIDFWGGDLQGIVEKLAYLHNLGINTIYLNPIFKAFTNHKYDTVDYMQIDPQFGTLEDLRCLANKAKALGIRIVLDGVFNHMGKKAIWFQQAQQAPDNFYRNFFYFGNYKHGYRAWANVSNLPELNLENPQVQQKMFLGKNSVLKHYLQIVSGWRLDVAHDLGPALLKKITTEAHRVHKQALVVGEIWNYPDGWLQSIDGIMNFYLRQLILEIVKGAIPPQKGSRLLEKLIEDCGLEPLLKSWIILSNHDTPRLTSLLPEMKMRKLALILQFTLPGSPVIYYGEEIGMVGHNDPTNRGPMDWEKTTRPVAIAKFYKKLLNLRNRYKALQYGNCRPLITENVLAFARVTHLVEDLVVIALNPSKQAVVEVISLQDYKLMSWGKLKEYFTNEEIRVFSGMATLKIPPQSFRIYTPVIEKDGYTPYKRIR